MSTPEFPPAGWKRPLRCSFCCRSEHDVSALITETPDVAICDQCVAACNSVLRDHHATPGDVEFASWIAVLAGA